MEMLMILVLLIIYNNIFYFFFEALLVIFSFKTNRSCLFPRHMNVCECTGAIYCIYLMINIELWMFFSVSLALLEVCKGIWRILKCCRYLSCNSDRHKTCKLCLSFSSHLPSLLSTLFSQDTTYITLC